MELGSKLKAALQRLASALVLDSKLVEEVLKEVERALLECDVNVRLVKQICERVRKRAREEKIPAGLTKREHVLKVLYEELINLMGKESKPWTPDKKPYLVLLAGLLGSGKTTTCAKLAYYLKRKGYSVAMVCADPYRPASYEQLRQLGERIGVPTEAVKGVVVQGIKEAVQRLKHKDCILVDTAGRHKEAEALMQELKDIYEAIKPDEVFLVVDASLGQVAEAQASAFKRAVPIGSIVVSKLDGTARGGGALSACAATGASIRFIGIGEKLEDLEHYQPQRFTSRMLGIPDLQAMLEKLKEVEPKLPTQEFCLEEFCKQLDALQTTPWEQLLDALPIPFKLSQAALEQSKRVQRFRHILNSMTPEERKNPEILDASRIRRIAKGSGSTEAEVRQLLNSYFQFKQVVKRLDKRALQRWTKQLGNALATSG